MNSGFLRISLSFVCCMILLTSNAQSELLYKWEDEFSDQEKEKVKTWLAITHKAVKAKIGDYPFKIHLFIYRRENQKEPVPWANTWRYPNQQIHFYIDPDYPLQAFIDDWTAPHEMSHLAIPYIGEEEAWFSEGFASFMQYQVMESMGIMSTQQCDSAYNSKVLSIADDFMHSTSKKSIGTIAMEQKKQKNYRAMYWGGATFFYQWNELLEQKGGTHFCALFEAYLKCCRKTDRGVDGVVRSLDQVSGYTFGNELLHQYRNKEAKQVFPMP